MHFITVTKVFSVQLLRDLVQFEFQFHHSQFCSHHMMITHLLEASPKTYALVAVLAFLLFSTYCITTIRYLLQRSCDRRYQGKEPSTLPYGVPGLGSALGLIRNPHGFFKSIV